MTDTDRKRVIVGKIGAPYGVRGWVKVYSYTEPKENLFSYPLLLETGRHGWRPLAIEHFKAHGDAFVVKLHEIEDRDQAALITNGNLAVYREDLPELDPEADKGSYYWADLIGLKVYNQNGIELGETVDFFATGANDVLVVQGETGEHLIPYVPEQYILNVDLAAKQMKVLWDLEI